VGGVVTNLRAASNVHQLEANVNQDEQEDTTIYKVVVNHEGQYSIWPVQKETPLGWREVGKTGPKAECLAYIKEVWTDTRPISLRKKVEEMENNQLPDSDASA
jgi:MbtH protein